MTTLILISLFTLCFAFIAWHKFYLALGILFFLLPSYLIRFQIFSIPSTILEIMIITILLIGLVQFKEDIIFQLHELKSKRPWLIFGIIIFLLAATISVFTSVDIKSAAGEWKAFYIEPFLLFFLLTAVVKEKKDLTIILFPLVLSGLITSVLAIYQHFTGWMVPWNFWQNGNSFRVTAWYGFPNGVGLFLAPIIPLALYVILKQRSKEQGVIGKISFFCSLLLVPFSLLAIFYAKSTGALVGLAGGVGVLLLVWKKTRWLALSAGLIFLITLILTPANNSIKQELLLRDRSGQVRMSIWEETINLIKSRPVLGAGLASFQERVTPFHTTINGEGIEIFEHPHNIFLTMYINLGLLGLLGFVWLIVWFYKEALEQIKYKDFSLTPFLLASITTILVHGLVDSPYIKNDLAIVFWLLFSLIVVVHNKDRKFL